MHEFPVRQRELRERLLRQYVQLARQRHTWSRARRSGKALLWTASQQPGGEQFPHLVPVLQHFIRLCRGEVDG
jgi:hypothetical protein